MLILIFIIEKILVKKGYLLSKTWRLRNTGKKAWPKKTKLITPFIEFHYDMFEITFEVKHEYIIDMTIVIDIPPVEAFSEGAVEKVDKNNKFVKLCFNLITPEDIIIGDDFVLTLHYNENIFDEILQKTDHAPNKGKLF